MGNDGWQSMDSAPKDRVILGSDFEDITTIFWYQPTFTNCYGRWELVVSGHCSKDDEWEPLRWMECPEGPNNGD